jgi:hypothetical protein
MNLLYQLSCVLCENAGELCYAKEDFQMPRLSKKAKAEWSIFYLTPLPGSDSLISCVSIVLASAIKVSGTKIIACPKYQERVQTGASDAPQSQKRWAIRV